MVVEEFGSEHWYPRFIKEPFRTIVRQSVQEYPSRELKAERVAIQAQRTMANAPNHTTVYIPVGTNGLPLVHAR